MYRPTFGLRAFLVFALVLGAGIPIGLKVAALWSEDRARQRYCDLQERFEASISDRIEHCLGNISGIRVSVAVELDWLEPSGNPELASLKPVRGVASIGVPASYVQRVSARLKEIGKTASTQDLRSSIASDIENAVVGLLPPTTPGADPYPQVTVRFLMTE